MNKVFVYEFYSKGVYGNQKYITYLASYLPSSLVSVFLCTEFSSAFYNHLCNQNVEASLYSVPKLPEWLRLFLIPFLLLRPIRSVKPTCLLAHNSPSLFCLILPSFLFRIPLFWHIKGELNLGVLDILFGLFSRHIFFISPQLFDSKSFVFKYLFEKKSSILPLGVELDSWTSLSPPCFQGDVLKLLYIGSITPRKGLNVLLDSLGLFSSNQICLDIVGDFVDKNKEYNRSILLEIARLPNVCFHGYQADIYRFMQKSHVVILPSYSEGTPRSLVEAMASARPVISTKVGGTPFIVMSDTTGYLVPPGDSHSLYSAIKKFLENPPLVHDFGLRARALSLEKHDIKKHFLSLRAFLSR